MSSYMLSPGEIALAATSLDVSFKQNGYGKSVIADHINQVIQHNSKPITDEELKLIILGDKKPEPEDIIRLEQYFLFSRKPSDPFAFAKTVARILALENLLGVCHRYSDIAQNAVGKGEPAKMPGVGYGIKEYLDEFKPEYADGMNFFSFLDSFCQMTDKWVEYFSNMYKNGLPNKDQRLGKRCINATSYQACDMLPEYNQVSLHDKASSIADRWPGNIFDTFNLGNGVELDSENIRSMLGMAGVPENLAQAASEFMVRYFPEMSP